MAMPKMKKEELYPPTEPTVTLTVTGVHGIPDKVVKAEITKIWEREKRKLERDWNTLQSLLYRFGMDGSDNGPYGRIE